MNKESVSEQIRKAFKGVKLGGGIGLWQAQAIDDYQSEEVQLQERERDEKEDWRKITTDTLCRCESSLSFFDADGMRFHLPAFMLASLNEESNDSVVFHLWQLDEYALSKLTSLNDNQVRAIVAFLNWYKTQEDNDFEAPSIERALTEFWEKSNKKRQGDA